jgi:hypothetical protein
MERGDRLREDIGRSSSVRGQRKRRKSRTLVRSELWIQRSRWKRQFNHGTRRNAGEFGSDGSPGCPFRNPFVATGTELAASLHFLQPVIVNRTEPTKVLAYAHETSQNANSAQNVHSAQSALQNRQNQDSRSITRPSIDASERIVGHKFGFGKSFRTDTARTQVSNIIFVVLRFYLIFLVRSPRSMNHRVGRTQWHALAEQ